MHHSGAIIVLIMSTLIAAGCGTPERDFSKLTAEFVYSTLTFSPIAATAAGLHQYQGQNLDEQLDDISPAALGHQREYYQRFSERLQNEVKPDTLSAESRADFHIMLDQIALRLLDLDETQSYLHNPTVYVEMVGNALFTPLSLRLLDLDETQSYLHNPTVYVEMVGNALFTPLSLEYAPLPLRIRHIVARLQKLPLLLDQARTNLISSPDIWTKVAIEENEGNIALVDKTIRAAGSEEHTSELQSLRHLV